MDLLLRILESYSIRPEFFARLQNDDSIAQQLRECLKSLILSDCTNAVTTAMIVLANIGVESKHLIADIFQGKFY